MDRYTLKVLQPHLNPKYNENVETNENININNKKVNKNPVNKNGLNKSIIKNINSHIASNDIVSNLYNNINANKICLKRPEIKRYIPPGKRFDHPKAEIDPNILAKTKENLSLIKKCDIFPVSLNSLSHSNNSHDIKKIKSANISRSQLKSKISHEILDKINSITNHNQNLPDYKKQIKSEHTLINDISINPLEKVICLKKIELNIKPPGAVFVTNKMSPDINIIKKCNIQVVDESFKDILDSPKVINNLENPLNKNSIDLDENINLIYYSCHLQSLKSPTSLLVRGNRMINLPNTCTQPACQSSAGKWHISLPDTPAPRSRHQSINCDYSFSGCLNDNKGDHKNFPNEMRGVRRRRPISPISCDQYLNEPSNIDQIDNFNSIEGSSILPIQRLRGDPSIYKNYQRQAQNYPFEHLTNKEIQGKENISTLPSPSIHYYDNRAGDRNNGINNAEYHQHDNRFFLPERTNMHFIHPLDREFSDHQYWKGANNDPTSFSYEKHSYYPSTYNDTRFPPDIPPYFHTSYDPNYNPGYNNQVTHLGNLTLREPPFTNRIHNIDISRANNTENNSNNLENFNNSFNTHTNTNTSSNSMSSFPNHNGRHKYLTCNNFSNNFRSNHDPKTYSSPFTCSRDLNDPARFERVIEVSGFPTEFKTLDLKDILTNSGDSELDILWVDDNHALAVFTSSKYAQDALNLNHPLLKCKSYDQASSKSKLKAEKSLDSVFANMICSKPRPQTTVVIARRFIEGHLGIRVSTDEEIRQKQLKEFKEAVSENKRLQESRNTADVWDENKE
ncbi:unnamed protein product [Gordionus sp. m RMFG-2023]